MRACSPGCVQSGSRVRVHSPQECAARSVVSSQPSQTCQCSASSCCQVTKWCSSWTSIPHERRMSSTLSPTTTTAAIASAMAASRIVFSGFGPP